MDQGKINYCLYTFVTSLEHANVLLWTLKSGLAACSVHRYMFGGLGDSAAMWLHVAGVRECKCYLKFGSWLVVDLLYCQSLAEIQVVAEHLFLVRGSACISFNFSLISLPMECT